MAEILGGLGIKTIIRLNKVEYNRDVFLRKGFKHFDFYYEDGSIPDEVK